MNEKIKTICLILITIAIVIGTVFYCWGIYEDNRNPYPYAPKIDLEKIKK